ncbi:MAG: hypothetical protein MK226_08640 [Saprospiraceae bacterium]|jgi:hypothetical protein|nr:hypothetical protein [Saprospiraceae bacterium]
MGGIRDLIGLHFIMDTKKKIIIESLLKNKRQIPKEKLLLIKELLGEKLSSFDSLLSEEFLGNKDLKS